MKKTLVVLLIVGGLLVAMAAGASAQDEEAGPFIPAILSLIIPGWGQLINGEVNKAILHFALDVANWTIWSLLSSFPSPIPIGYLSGVAALGLRVYSAYDAYTVADERGFSIGLRTQNVMLAYHL